MPVQPTKEIESGKPIPPPPVAKPAKIPTAPPPHFLEPLQITLKGVIVGSDELLDVAIIEDTKEKRAKNYRINDKIEDAQLIKIFKNKIILIRSNGQQETLYVSQHDAEIEQLLSPRNNWSAIIQKRNDTTYAIDPDLFIERITNLAQLIDLFNLTTVYKQGKSIGCRIGRMQPGSPGLAMGLLPGDIIETINDIPATESNSRFEIYKNVIGQQIGDMINVQLLRKNYRIRIIYVLEKLEQQPKIAAPPPLPKNSAEQPDQPKVTSPEQPTALSLSNSRQKYAKTVNQMQSKDKQMMVKQGTNYNREKMNRNILSTHVQPALHG